MTSIFLHDFEIGSDKSKHNRGGMNNPDTLLEQGDFPVNIIDLQKNEEYNVEMAKMMASEDTPYVKQPRSAGDINEGVSMIQPMYSDAIRKNSDY